MSGSRSSLFYEFVRLVKEIKPKYFILENVNSMPKEAKNIITEELFFIEPVMINASLVSAQNRKRLFWVGKLVGDTYEKVEIYQPKDEGILLKDILESEVDDRFYVKVNEKYGLKVLCEDNEKSKSMTATMHKGYGSDGATTVRIGHLNQGGQGDRIYSQEGKSVNLSANGGGRGAKTGLYLIQDKKVSVRKHEVNIKELQKTLREHKTITNKEISEKLNIPPTTVEHWFRTDNSFSIPDKDIWYELKKLLKVKTDEFDKSITEFEIKDGNFDQSKRVYIGDKTPTLQTGQQNNYKVDNKIRKLTPKECERLQSLPDNYTQKGITDKGEIEISNTQRYKTLGNGFNSKVIEHIIKHLFIF